MDFAEAIDRFRAEHPEWKTQNGALYQCDGASVQFLEFLKIHGIAERINACSYTFYTKNIPSKLQKNPCGQTPNVNPDPRIYTKGSNESGDTRADWHYIIETDFCFIDWTARQYTLDVPYPYIIPKKADAASA